MAFDTYMSEQITEKQSKEFHEQILEIIQDTQPYFNKN